jgi:ribosomal RNA methyltransferase Nop2
MGRRAKNKQAAPEPLDAKIYTSPRKLGKRKADADVETDGKDRPLKKAKDTAQKTSGEKRFKKAKVPASESTKSAPNKANSKKVVQGDFNGEDSGDGWEDVADDMSPEAQSK